MNSLDLIIKDQDIAVENAKQLIEAFGAPFTDAGEILSTYKEIVVNNINQKELMADAKSKRLTLKKIRTTVENKRKILKEDSLRTGKAIDSVAKYIKDNIQPAEEYLELQEKYAEIEQEKLIAELRRDRAEKLAPYTDTPHIYQLASMTFDDFEKLVKELKDAKDLQEAKDKAYADEQIRIVKEKEIEDLRIREENNKLKIEVDKRAAELKIERDKIEKIKQDQEVERIEKERLEQVNKKAIEDAEYKKQLSEAKLASAPDREKLLLFVSKIEVLEVPTNTEVAKRISKHISESTNMYRKLINEEL